MEAPPLRSATVAAGDPVLLLLNNERYVFASADARGAAIKVGKRDRVKGKDLVGLAWGAEMLAQGGKLIPAAPASASEQLAGEEADEVGAQSATTSKLVWDDNTAQALTNDDISRMKSEGRSGQDIVAALVSNSSSFKNKSQFAQAKYLNKKKRKHEARFVIVRPTAAAVCAAMEASPKTQGLRSDSLAALLTWTGVASGQRVLVHDPTGVLAAAVLERLGGTGELVLLHSGQQPPHGQLNRYALSAAERRPLVHASLAHALAPQRTAHQHLTRPFDVLLVVATTHDPRQLLPPLLELLQAGCVVGVFGAFLAPLSDCFAAMLTSGRYVRVQLSETWQRAYQVLPQRTHPTMSTHGASGYVLSAIKIIPPASHAAAAAPPPPPAPIPAPAAATALQPPQEDERASKKVKKEEPEQ